MTIETKADLGQMIYYLNDNRVHFAPVKRITFSILRQGYGESENKKPISLTEYETCHGKFLEENVFLSRKELAESLMKE